MKTKDYEKVLPCFFRELTGTPSDKHVWLAIDWLANKLQTSRHLLIDEMSSKNGKMLCSHNRRWYVAYEQSGLAELGIEEDCSHDELE